jgi:hypothetical protein
VHALLERGLLVGRMDIVNELYVEE